MSAPASSLPGASGAAAAAPVGGRRRPPPAPAHRDPDHRLVRSLVTPEGVDLKVRLARRGDRVGAFLLDLVFLGLLLGALAILLLLILPRGPERSPIMAALMGTAVILGRVFYFVGFELVWNGQTPGKRVTQLRVIDSRGGPLTTRAVLARNFVREVELFQPLGLLLALQAQTLSDPLFEGHGVWLLLGLMAIFTFMPVFNRDRLRLGDMLAGTWVITLPAPLLQADLAQVVHAGQLREAQASGTGAPRYRFTAQHLEAYGIHELQVLEDVLRRPELGPADVRLMIEIAERITRRTGYGQPPPASDSRAFLEAYYAALRSHLETRRRFGDERADKYFRERRRAAAGATPPDQPPGQPHGPSS